MYIDPERIGWLRTLITAYCREHDWDADEDEDATNEMLQECRRLADELEAHVPPERDVQIVPPGDELPF